jgi:hypothetical protein
MCIEKKNSPKLGYTRALNKKNFRNAISRVHWLNKISENRLHVCFGSKKFM